MSAPSPQARRVLVTGAAGFLGQGLISALAQGRLCEAVIAVDVRELPAAQQLPGITWVTQDVRDPALANTIAAHRIDTVVHLASIVTPGKDSSRAFEYSVDVGGTQNVLQACVQDGVRHIVVSSSGAAYGYHADNAPWLTEDMPLRGNDSFAYSHHKRLVEEMLAQYRQNHPQLAQTVLRIGTILGDRVDNQITALFEKPRLLAIQGSDSPFVFIWDEDVTEAILHALSGQAQSGCFNLAGDGALTIFDIARRLNKPPRVLPAWLLKSALWLGSRLGVSRYGPEQLDFLRYRPVLLNTALKTRFGYTPAKTSAEAFAGLIDARQRHGTPLQRQR
ncbi:epimerase [Limnohabitans sp. 2KL-1]|uniref:SDR family oxidoreductase n=1 Tax=Limnohabitans sp. 2KL-1 TaxID=1100699 RepID=UPI000D3C0C81|nr:SDR family oxidoreductase [Limnohabitans sp. 2KL-1]PUE48902.1 epimerase [Limnohabitans sp. 2KL-1]